MSSFVLLKANTTKRIVSSVFILQGSNLQESKLNGQNHTGEQNYEERLSRILFF